MVSDRIFGFTRYFSLTRSKSEPVTLSSVQQLYINNKENKCLQESVVQEPFLRSSCLLLAMSSAEILFFQIPTPLLLGAIGASTPYKKILKFMKWSRNPYLKDLQYSFINISFRPLLLLDPFDCVRVFG